MKWIVEYIQIDNKGNEVVPCGTENTWLINDLNTLRGVQNRVLKGYIPTGTHKIKISSYTNLYNEDTYTLRDIILL